MLAQLGAGVGDCALDLGTPAAAADSTVADRRQRLAACQLREAAAAERLDAETVERERQARLARWQRLDSRP